MDFTTNFSELNLDLSIESIIKKLRPVIIMSNNIINKFNSDVFIIPLTSIIQKVSFYQYLIKKDENNNLEKDSKALILQSLFVNKEYRLKKRIDKISENEFRKII